jgi:iron complex outermembrane receptor protein
MLCIKKTKNKYILTKKNHKMKKLLQQHRVSLFLIKALVLYLGFSTQAMAQQIVQGKVTDDKSLPLIGVSIAVKGTNKGTNTDADGKYSIDAKSSATLIFNYVGFKSKQVVITNQTTVNVVLQEDTQALDEVVVTGVFDKRTRMESSVSISTISAKQFDKIAITSSADLLKNIPGVFVNSSLGEIRNTVYSRGVSVGSNDGASGYYYVSMQEDGLPVTNATFGNYGPDYFLRTDATLGKLEAVRGGTASILGNNAPGGIFNYVSKTGGSKFEGEIRAKYGLEGNGKNPYYRTDFDFGGPLSKDKTLTYNIGGFLRQSDGARYSGYPMNNGGQIKANLVKTYKTGSVKLFAKYLDDHNGWNEFTPTIGFTDPHYPAGVTNTTSVLIPAVTADFTVNQTGQKIHYDSRDKIHSKDKSVGINWEQNLGNGWKLDNKIRFSDKSAIWNTTAVVYPFATDGLVFYAVSGNLFNFGTYSFNDHATGTQIGSVTSSPNIIGGNFAGFNYTVNNSNFPGASIQPNSLYFNPIFYQNNKMKEIIDQFTITKKIDKMTFTGGMFYAKSNLDKLSSTGIGESYSQMTSPRPSLTDISYVGLFDGQTYNVTNPDGITGGSGKSAPVDIITVSQKQMALFFGHTWEMSSKVNFDWGIRSETVAFNGNNQISEKVATTTAGGTDGDPMTLYDNTMGQIKATYNYSDKKVNTFSFSSGLNYKFADNQAIYGRYSLGNKAPDMDMFVTTNTAFGAANLNPTAQKIQQIEAGYKLKTGGTNLFVTPFYTIVSNVPQQTVGQETDDITTAYNTPVLYNKFRTMGVEFEVNQDFTEKFSVRAVATFQTSKAVEYKTWNIGANGAADDQIVDFSGNETDNNAKVILRVSPTYNSGKFFSSLDFSYMGKRAANVPNAFELPSYNQTNLNLGYNLTSKLQLQANINNLFNQIGVMGWSAPGGFPAALDRQGFTAEKLAANPNAVYSTLSLPARAYFITATYKF